MDAYFHHQAQPCPGMEIQSWSFSFGRVAAQIIANRNVTPKNACTGPRPSLTHFLLKNRLESAGRPQSANFFFAFSLSPRLNKIGKQNPNLGPVADHGSDDDDGSPDMTAIVSALAQQQQRASVTIYADNPVFTQKGAS